MIVTLDDIDPLRAEILRGGPVLALDTGRGCMEGMIREAAVLAGRSGDVRVIHLQWPLQPLCRLGPYSRIPGPGSLPTPEAIIALTKPVPGEADGVSLPAAPLDIMSATLAHEVLSTVPHAFRGLPGIGLGEMLAPDAIVIVQGKGDEAEILLSWLASRVPIVAQEARRRVPLIFVDHQMVTLKGRLPGWDHVMSPLWAQTGPYAWCHRTRPHGSVEPSLTDRLRWREARSTAPDAVASDRVVTVTSQGRTAIARRCDYGTSDQFLGYDIEVVEIGEDGWCEGVTLPGLILSDSGATGYTPDGRPVSHEGDAVMAELARAAALGGLSLLVRYKSDPTIGQAVTPYAHAITSVLHDGAHALGYPSVAAKVAGLVDGDLLVALGTIGMGQSVIRLIAADPALAPARRDFAMTWPAFSELLLDPAFLRIVDGGGETVPAVAAHLGITPAMARRLVGRAAMPDYCLGPLSPHGGSRLAIGAYLGPFGHDRLPPPGDEMAWISFARASNMIARFLARSGSTTPTPESLAGLLLGIPGATWQERYDAIIGNSVAGYIDISDFVRAFTRMTGAMNVTGASYNLGFEALCEFRSLLRLREASDLWHDTPHLRDEPSAIAKDATWPMPFGTVHLGEGWSAVPMGSMRSLAEEGAKGPDDAGIEGLDHCVATYADRCSRARCIILSIRHETADGIVRVSTAELVRDVDGEWPIGTGAFSLGQHRGPRNAAPPVRAEQALADLRRRLVDGEIPIDEQALLPREPRECIAAPVNREALLASWDRVLPESLRGLDPDGFARAMAAIRVRREERLDAMAARWPDEAALALAARRALG